MQPLYLSHLGIINALGEDGAAVLMGALSGDTRGIVCRNDLLLDKPVFVAEVGAALPPIVDMPIEFNSRNNRLLLAAYQQIAGAVDVLIAKYGVERIAVVLGSSTSGIAETEVALKVEAEQSEFPQGYHYSQQEMGSPSAFLAYLLGLKNVALTISTACSSSGKAFATARNLIESGFCDAALVGGVDSLCRLTLNGFHALESVSATVCKPFSRYRDGITIGEGAALFILSPQTGSSSEAIELVGIGESSDAYHISAPEPEGLGAEAAMRQALMDAGLTPEGLVYLNLHGTATSKNDAMEAAVVHRLFGERLPCSSTKSITGHTLGAAGATELGICWLLLSTLNKAYRLPPQIWDGQWDAALAPVCLVAENAVYLATGSCYVMSNSFAFGGSNVSLIIRRQF